MTNQEITHTIKGFIAGIVLIPAFILIMLALATPANGQIAKPFEDGFSVSASPYSIPLWGQSPAAAKATARFGIFEAVFVHTFKTMYDNEGHVNTTISRGGGMSAVNIKKTKRVGYGTYEGSWFGLFALPLKVSTGNLHMEGGVGYFFKRFPTKNGTHINFTLQIEYDITDTIGVRYSHISNGFGAFNSLNPGLDNLSIVINL